MNHCRHMYTHDLMMLFLLLICAFNTVSALNSNSGLVHMLQQVIVPPKLLQKTQPRPVVIITAFNLGFRWHLLNFDCFMKRLSLPYLAVSMDEEGQNWIKRHDFAISTVFVPFRHELSVSNGTHGFRSHHYNVLTARKIRVVIEVLSLGYDLFFVDPDVALLHNPFPYLLWNNVDYVHSLNDKCNIGDVKFNYFHNPKIEGNTGLYFIRSTQSSIFLLNASYHVMKKTHFKTDDQAYFWHFLRANETAKRVLPIGKCRDLNQDNSLKQEKNVENKGREQMALCALDPCHFTVGTVHNYLHGKIQPLIFGYFLLLRF